MKTRLLIIIGIAITISFVAGWQIGISTFYYTDDPNRVSERSYVFAPDTAISYAEFEELECLRLYKDIREISRTDGMALAERETIDMHKSLVFEYVDKNCPDFPDLEFIYNNYKQNILEPESYSIEKLLMDNNIGVPKELFVQRTISMSGGDPACGIAVDNLDKLHWFGIDSFSNPNKMTVLQENPQPCKVNTSSCFCDVYTKLISLTTELTYFTPEEEQKYSDILIDYLAEENINRTPKFLIGKLNINYTDSSAIGYCGEIWGKNTYGFFDGAIVNDVVMDYGISKELPLLCAISDDGVWWERK